MLSQRQYELAQQYKREKAQKEQMRLELDAASHVANPPSNNISPRF